MSVESPIRESHKWFRGADKNFRFTVLDDDGVAVDITGWAVEWVVRKHKGDQGTALLSKTAGSGIILTTPASGILTVAVADTDTDGIPAGTYYYTLWRTDAGVEVELAFGEAVLRQPAKRA